MIYSVSQILILLYQKDQTTRTQRIAACCRNAGRSIGRVWKLSETLPMGRVSGFDISFELSENRRT